MNLSELCIDDKIELD